jgi:hypothetical protein
MQPSFERDSLTEALFEWAESLGVWLNPKLRYPVRFPPGYLGIQTTEAILPGESILSAPNQSMLSTKFINHPSLEPLFTSNPSLFSIPDKNHEDNRFLTYFLWEYSKGRSSFWFTYFEYLPKDLETLVDWTDDELLELQDDDLRMNVKRKREKDFNNYNLLRSSYLKFPDLFCEDDIEIHRIHWVWKIICTRSYSGKIPYTTLIPIADLFNHSNVNTNYFYGTEKEESPDADDVKLEENPYDDDDPINDTEKVVQLSNLKLYRLSLGPPSKFNKVQMQKNNEILKEAKILDQKIFLQSNTQAEMTSATKGINTSGVGESDTHKFRMTCSKFERFEAGSEVFIRYGNYSNRQLLLHYGFAMKDNCYTYARIKTSLDFFLSPRQRQDLSGGYSLNDTVIFKVRSNELCLDIIKAFRGFLWDIDIHDSESFLNPKDKELEEIAVEMTLDFLFRTFHSFRTSIEEDEQELKTAEYKKYFAVFAK